MLFLGKLLFDSALKYMRAEYEIGNIYILHTVD